MKNFLASLLFILIALPAYIVSAHGSGGTFEEVIDGYLVDVGYATSELVTDELTRFDFQLYNQAGDTPVTFSNLWVRLEHETRPVFAGPIGVADLGAPGFSILFSDPGQYTLEARFSNQQETIVVFKKDFTVAAADVPFSAYQYRWHILLITVLLIATYFSKRYWLQVIRRETNEQAKAAITVVPEKKELPATKSLESVIDSQTTQMLKDAFVKPTNLMNTKVTRVFLQALVLVVVATITFFIATWVFSWWGTMSMPTVSSQSLEEYTANQIVYVTLTEAGYQPAELSVDRGTKVIFRTTIDRPHWPASNLHPSHGIYPEFDPKEPIPADEEWSFIFDRPGDWKFHDHIRSYYTGVVHVAD